MSSKGRKKNYAINKEQRQNFDKTDEWIEWTVCDTYQFIHHINVYNKIQFRPKVWNRKKKIHFQKETSSYSWTFPQKTFLGQINRNRILSKLLLFFILFSNNSISRFFPFFKQIPTQTACLYGLPSSCFDSMSVNVWLKHFFGVWIFFNKTIMSKIHRHKICMAYICVCVCKKMEWKIYTNATFHSCSKYHLLHFFSIFIFLHWRFLLFLRSFIILYYLTNKNTLKKWYVFLVFLCVFFLLSSVFPRHLRIQVLVSE